MKRVKMGLAILAVAILSTGCTLTGDMKTTIGNDRQVTFVEEFLIDDQMAMELVCQQVGIEDCVVNEETIQSYINERIEQEKRKYGNLQAEVKAINETDKRGFTITAKLGDIDDNVTGSATKFNLANPAPTVGLFRIDGYKYKSNIIFEPSEDIKAAMIANEGAYEVKYTLSTPIKIESHNGVEKDNGKTVEWTLTKPMALEFEFDFENAVEIAGDSDYGKIAISPTLLGLGTLAVVIAVILVVGAISKSGKEKEDANANQLQTGGFINTPVQPVQPIQPQATANQPQAGQPVMTDLNNLGQITINQSAPVMPEAPAQQAPMDNQVGQTIALEPQAVSAEQAIQQQSVNTGSFLSGLDDDPQGETTEPQAEPINDGFSSVAFGGAPEDIDQNINENI